MFHHVKDLQFNARVSKPDPRFARLLLEQFGGGNGELKAAMQYFVQAFGCRRAYPDKYDLLMDVATEEFSHLEIVGATITMLLDGVNGELKDAAEVNPITGLMNGNATKEQIISDALFNPAFCVQSAGGPTVTDCNGVPWSGVFVNANGDLTVDMRSNIAAESRAKIVYEYLLKFTDDEYVRQTLRFLMTREVTHFQQFSAALATIEPNFPPGVLQADPRYSHTSFNMSRGEDARGPWNQGQGPWPQGEQWEHVEDPIQQAIETNGQESKQIPDFGRDPKEAAQIEQALSEIKRAEASVPGPAGEGRWSTYDGEQKAEATGGSDGDEREDGIEGGQNRRPPVMRRPSARGNGSNGKPAARQKSRGKAK